MKRRRRLRLAHRVVRAHRLRLAHLLPRVAEAVEAAGDKLPQRGLRQPCRALPHRLARPLAEGVAAMRRLRLRACWGRSGWWHVKGNFRRRAGGTACPTGV